MYSKASNPVLEIISKSSKTSPKTCFEITTLGIAHTSILAWMESQHSNPEFLNNNSPEFPNNSNLEFPNNSNQELLLNNSNPELLHNNNNLESPPNPNSNNLESPHNPNNNPDNHPQPKVPSPKPLNWQLYKKPFWKTLE